MPSQLSHDGLGALQFAEFTKHELKAALHLFIRLEDSLSTASSRQAGRQRKTQFASRGFLLLALM